MIQLFAGSKGESVSGTCNMNEEVEMLTLWENAKEI